MKYRPPARELDRRHHRPQRHRRAGRRRDLDLLRSDDRQARDPRAVARRRDRGAGDRARFILHRRHPPQHSVPVGPDAASALARGQSVHRLHRRGISEGVCGSHPRGRDRAPAGRGRRRHRSCARRTQAADFRPADRPAWCSASAAARYGSTAPKSRSISRARPTASWCVLSAPTARSASPHHLVSPWKPGDPVWQGTIDGHSVAMQVRPIPNGFRLAHQGYEVAVFVFTESEATRGAADAGRRQGRHRQEAAVPDAGARGVDRGQPRARRSRPARRWRWWKR